MGRKPKYTFEAKIKVVQEYLNGKSSISTTAKQLNANENTIRQWVTIYQSQGADGLQYSHTNKHPQMYEVYHK